MRINKSLLTCSIRSIGLYTWLRSYLQAQGQHEINAEIPVSEFIRLVKGMETTGFDNELSELEQIGLIRYSLHIVSVKALEPVNQRANDLIGQLDGVWDEWVRYKAEVKKSAYKTAISEQRMFEQCIREANGDKETVKNALMHSMAHGWHGPNIDVYIKKVVNNQNSKHEQQSSTSKIGRIASSEIERFINED